ncbi:MAG: helix-turn-helix domain-containing protein [Defluviitaleaceae bacterium]|nr:helix-turn-helix domain-containing protein [Defluviitaleaceae bacterium]
MKPEITKESLIQEFLVFTFVSKSGLRKFIIKIETYMDKKPPDLELTLILSTLKTVKADNDQQSFEVCCATATPAFEALKSIPKWEYLHLYCMSILITYRFVFDESWVFFGKALNALENYNDDKYLQIRTALHFNMTMRILRTKYLEPSISNTTLNAKFSQCYDYAMDICVKRERPQQHVLKVRKGIYDNNMELIRKGLTTLRKLKETKRYKNAKADIVEYLNFMEEDLTTDLMNTLQGYQIGKRRRELKLSVLELADLTGMEETTINAVERGDCGVSSVKLKRLSKALNVSVDYILGNDSAKPEDEDIYVSRFKAYTSRATKAQKELFMKSVSLCAEALNLSGSEAVPDENNE